MKLDNYSTALRTIPRYLKINPDFKETYVEFLLEKKLYNKAGETLVAILEDEGYSSKAMKDKRDFYFDMVNLITEHPEDITCVDGYKFIREGLRMYPDDSGKIWVKISDYFIRLGEFDKARAAL